MEYENNLIGLSHRDAASRPAMGASSATQGLAASRLTTGRVGRKMGTQRTANPVRIGLRKLKPKE